MQRLPRTHVDDTPARWPGPWAKALSANTALAVASVAPGTFMDFHYSLYQKQPQENGPGWTQAQLARAR